jgi:hypothetical protein
VIFVGATPRPVAVTVIVPLSAVDRMIAITCP